jgi:hypothetical protein
MPIRHSGVFAMTTLTEVPSLEIAPRPVVAKTLTYQRGPELDAALLLTPTGETTRDRWKWFGVMLVVAGLYACMTFGFWAPADGGVDQNAYLLGARLVAEHGTDKFVLSNPFAYVGGMMVRYSGLKEMGGTYYPKYPVGIPLIYAIGFWVVPKYAAVFALAVSPAMTVAAFIGMFLLGRAIAGSFAGLLGAILLGMNRLTIELAVDAKSHATDMCFIIWGMYFLVRWWQTRGTWRGVIAGLLLGFTPSMRYSEVLLALPIAIACFSRVTPGQWKKSFGSAAALGVAVVLTGSCLALGLFGIWKNLVPANLQPMVHGQHIGRWQPAAGWALLVLGAALVAYGLVKSMSRGDRTTGLFRQVVPDVVWISVAGLLAVVALYSRFAETRPDTAWSSVLYGSTMTVGLAGLVLVWAIAVRESWYPFFRHMWPMFCFAIPVAGLLIYNKCTIGDWTGYDQTNESEGFQLSKMWDTGEHVFRTYYTYATYFVMPLAVIGFGVMFRKNWKLALMVLAWLLPGSFLYAAYYWSPDTGGNAYPRFFLAYAPAIILAAAVFLGDWTSGAWTGGWKSGWGRTVVAGLVVAFATYVPVHEEIFGLQSGEKGSGGMGGRRGGGGMGSSTILDSYRSKENLYYLGKLLVNDTVQVPEHAVLFVQSGGGIENAENYIQFLKDWNVFSVDAFNESGRGGRGGGGGMRDPANVNNLVGAAPRQELQEKYNARIHSLPGQSTLESEMLKKELAAGHEVWLLASTGSLESDERAIANRVEDIVGGNPEWKKVEWKIEGTWTDVGPISLEKPSPGNQAIPDAHSILAGLVRSNKAGTSSRRGQGGGNRRNNNIFGGGMNFGGGGRGGRGGGPGGPGFDQEGQAPTVWRLVKLVPATGTAKPRPVSRDNDYGEMP